MPPKINRDQSVSENEGKSANSRASTKARNAAAQAAQAELLARHIHSNGPNEKVIEDPMDFDTLPDQTLRDYKELYHLPMKSAYTMNGYLLASDIGKKTLSYKNRDRVAKPELAAAVKRHMLSQPVKESEIVTNFLYKVSNQDKAFKLSFKNP
jgi:histone deacetylase complex subunit SAP30